MFWFKFKKGDSRDYNLMIESIPSIPTWEPTDTWIIIKFAIKNKDIPHDLFELKKWLWGDGKLVLGHMPDCFLNIESCILKQMSINDTFTTYEIHFEVKPGVFLIEGEEMIEFNTTSKTLFNPGNNTAYPLIKIFSNDMVTLTVNARDFVVSRINGYVILDSDLQDSYDNFGFKNDDVDGGFPQFSPGENNITVRGTFSKIEIIPRWRCM